MTGPSTPAPRVGLSLTAAFLGVSAPNAASVVRAAAEAELDHIQIGDHISFHDGTGFDGLIHATAALAMQDRVPVSVGLYLLALRHPVAVARQLADLERMFPGRLRLGVGVGGEDRHEFEVNGVDPRTRGRRTDESLTVLRRLLTGQPVTHHGEFFDLNEAVVLPAPVSPIPLVIGGRSDAALRRTAHSGDGWLALWVSRGRYADALAEIDAEAEACGRQVREWRHGLSLWCGVPGNDGHGRERLAAAMEERYKMPFERFERWCPVGEPAEIADFIGGYVDAGCSDVTLVLPAGSPADLISSAAEIRQKVLDDRTVSQ